MYLCGEPFFHSFKVQPVTETTRHLEPKSFHGDQVGSIEKWQRVEVLVTSSGLQNSRETNTDTIPTTRCYYGNGIIQQLLNGIFQQWDFQVVS